MGGRASGAGHVPNLVAAWPEMIAQVASGALRRARGILPGGAARRVATRAISLDDVPRREEQVEALRSREFDVLIVGGGATGAGCAVEAATRGARLSPPRACVRRL